MSLDVSVNNYVFILNKEGQLFHIDPLPEAYCGVPQSLNLGNLHCVNEDFIFMSTRKSDHFTRYDTMTQETLKIIAPAPVLNLFSFKNFVIIQAAEYLYCYDILNCSKIVSEIAIQG